MFGIIMGIALLIAGIAIGVTMINHTSYEDKEEFLLDESGNKIPSYYGSGYKTKTVKIETKPLKKYSGIAFVGGVVLLVLCVFVSCIISVPTGHTGIVTTFGRVENYTLDAGIHFQAPWQSVVKMDNRVQKDTVQLACFSSDIQEVNVKYTINYQIDKANAMNIYRSIGKSYYDIVIAPNIIEVVKEITALYTAENLINCREELSNKIESKLSEKLTAYNINVVNLSCEDMDFSDVFTNAVEAKQVAQQNKLKAETEAEQRIIEAEAAAEIKKVETEAQAEAAKISADAEAYQIKTKADAEAEANKKVAESLTDSLIEYAYAQGWDGKLPTFVSGSDGVIPVLDSIN